MSHPRINHPTVHKSAVPTGPHSKFVRKSQKTKVDKEQNKRLAKIEKFIKGDTLLYSDKQTVLSDLITYQMLWCFPVAKMTGRAMTIGSQRLRFFFENRANDALMVRLLYLKYKCEVNAGATSVYPPILTDILEEDTVLSAYNRGNRARYKIIRDKTLNISHALANPSEMLFITNKKAMEFKPLDDNTYVWLPFTLILSQNYSASCIRWTRAFDYTYVRAPEN